MTKLVYYFGDGQADGNAGQKALLGGKGANLAEMAALGLPVPAGFTITTEVCRSFLAEGRWPPAMEAQVREAMKRVETVMGAKFGDPARPLLLSCRSGARASMPGMMDTVLNLGCSDATMPALARLAGDERFAWDCYRRLVQMYGDVVLGIGPQAAGGLDPFEEILDEARRRRSAESDSELTAADLKEISARFQQVILTRSGKPFPQDPWEQLWAAIASVFASWNNRRAVVYRRHYNIPDDWGTACNIQAMVFGNLGPDCATGVALTREGSFGTPGLHGDYLINAQGEDVVAGIRRPKRIEQSMAAEMPAAYQQLRDMAQRLERHFRDMQDIEFTIQHGKVWMLQTRDAKRTGYAAIRVAVDLVDEGLIQPREAISSRRIPAAALEQLLQPVFEPSAKEEAIRAGRRLTQGVAAGPGAATGRICLSADEVEALAAADPAARLILVRRATSADDIHGMKAAAGIVTAMGGTSSHAALVSRQMGRPCVVGCRELSIDMAARTVTVGQTVLRAGDELSIDGFSGEVFRGAMATRPSAVLAWLNDPRPELETDDVRCYRRVMEWADEFRRLGVRANADKPDQGRLAAAFGAEGIGLCRTEHMFFDHVEEFRAMILAETSAERQVALDRLLPLQREDFIGLFRVMAGKPINIRLLDPPLHEFLPKGRAELDHLAARLGKDSGAVQRRVRALEESNPMLGHRGSRLGIVYPEITRMQTRAILEAACQAAREGLAPHVEIMVPLVFSREELDHQAQTIRGEAEKVLREFGCRVKYSIGTMIEVPRAALVAGDIAQSAEFFSFGTNDLTQTTFGMSRDDSGPFLAPYLEANILRRDPFQSIDEQGVGELLRTAVELGRAQKKDLPIGICGEHGGDPDSVKFCHRLGMDYVSCSPFRLPVARLAAAQAAVECAD